MPQSRDSSFDLWTCRLQAPKPEKMDSDDGSDGWSSLMKLAVVEKMVVAGTASMFGGSDWKQLEI